MQNSSVVSLLRYTDYEQDWAGVTETLSWARLCQRTLNVAHQVTRLDA